MKKASKFFAGTIAIAAIFVLTLLGVLDQPISFVQKIASQVYAPFYRASINIGRTLDHLSHAGTLSDQIITLEKEKTDLLTQIVNQTELQKENDILKKALQFKTEKKVTLIPAHIFIRLKEDDTNVVGLDVGTNQKLEKGDAVITEAGVMVGKVWQVDADTSKVLVITDSKSKIGADVVGVNNFGGIVEGQYGLGIALTTIPQDADIKPKSIVITSGLENQIPRGLLLGEVVEVVKEDRDPFLKAILKNLVSIDTVHTVFVVKK